MQIMTKLRIHAYFFGVIMTALCVSGTIVHVPVMQEEEIALSAMTISIPRLIPLNGTCCLSYC